MTEPTAAGIEGLLRADLRGGTPYGAPQLDVPGPAQHQRELLPGPARGGRRDHRGAWPRWRPGSTATPTASSPTCGPRSRHTSPTPRRPACPSTPEQVWAGNGSNEVLQHLVLAFGGPERMALGFTPAYSMHPIISTDGRHRPGSTGCAGRGGAPFDLSVESAVAQVREHQPHVVFLCSPNNPTGTALGLDVVEARVCRGRAGRRRGRRGVRRVRPPRHAERADPAAGPAAAGGHPHDEQGVRVRRRPARLPRRRPGPRRRAAPGPAAVPPVRADPGDRRWRRCGTRRRCSAPSRRSRSSATGWCAELSALGLDPVPSDANFVLFGGLARRRPTWRDLLDRGVLVRDVGIPHYLRVTAGTPAETDAFLAAMAQVAESSRQAAPDRSAS